MHKKLLNPAAMEVIRAKIESEKLINKLSNHVLNNDEMSNTQITAALGLLRKSVPDLSAIEHSGEIETSRTLADVIKSLGK